MVVAIAVVATVLLEQLVSKKCNETLNNTTSNVANGHRGASGNETTTITNVAAEMANTTDNKQSFFMKCRKENTVSDERKRVSE